MMLFLQSEGSTGQRLRCGRRPVCLSCLITLTVHMPNKEMFVLCLVKNPMSLTWLPNRFMQMVSGTRVHSYLYTVFNQHAAVLTRGDSLPRVRSSFRDFITRNLKLTIVFINDVTVDHFLNELISWWIHKESENGDKSVISVIGYLTWSVHSHGRRQKPENTRRPNKVSSALTHEVPLSVGDVSGHIRLDHLQVQRPAAVRPRAELQVAALHVERKPADVDVTGALKYPWRTERGKWNRSRVEEVEEEMDKNKGNKFGKRRKKMETLSVGWRSKPLTEAKTKNKTETNKPEEEEEEGKDPEVERK